MPLSPLINSPSNKYEKLENTVFMQINYGNAVSVYYVTINLARKRLNKITQEQCISGFSMITDDHSYHCIFQAIFQKTVTHLMGIARIMYLLGIVKTDIAHLSCSIWVSSSTWSCRQHPSSRLLGKLTVFPAGKNTY